MIFFINFFFAANVKLQHLYSSMKFTSPLWYLHVPGQVCFGLLLSFQVAGMNFHSESSWRNFWLIKINVFYVGQSLALWHQ